ncbi:MAG TPA: hypothetical protein VGR63_13715 [Casimicrobiaceae bacterium]|jgi:hypothetical protein|nr:hypothetical protein [Casimicrobiaceae bacterium]
MKSTVIAPLFASVLLALSASPALAQGASKNTCAHPEDYPGRLASDTRRKAWQKSMDEYGNCIKKFAADQRAIADAAVKAGNDAVEEYNAVANKAKEAIEKSKD